jgi:hypothetical protein
VDNLERLYTIVAALALTSAIERLVLDRGTATLRHFDVQSISVEYASLLMFVGLVATMIPFYHGANVYLFETHVFGPDIRRPLAALMDFLFFFTQGLLFFFASRVIGDPELFFWVIVGVLIWDCIWEMFVYLSGESNFSQIRRWLYLNVATIDAVIHRVGYTPSFRTASCDGASRRPFWWCGAHSTMSSTGVRIGPASQMEELIPKLNGCRPFAVDLHDVGALEHRRHVASYGTPDELLQVPIEKLRIDILRVPGADPDPTAPAQERGNTFQRFPGDRRQRCLLPEGEHKRVAA